MTSPELNNLLRTLVISLTNSGWLKTSIGKILLGSNGQAHMNHWLKFDGEKCNDFGIKPLERIGNLLEYETHIVYISKDDRETKKLLDSKNQEFMNILETSMKDFLANKAPSPKVGRSSNSKIDKVLEELLN